MALRPKKRMRRKKFKPTIMQTLERIPVGEVSRMPPEALDMHDARMALVTHLEDVINVLIVGTHENSDIVRAARQMLPVIHKTLEEGKAVSEWMKEQQATA